MGAWLHAQKKNAGWRFKIAVAAFGGALFLQADFTAFANELSARPCNMEALASIPDRDRQPASVPEAGYPLQCSEAAREEDNVILKFNVRRNGKPANIEVIASTNACFVDHAIKAAKKWRYNCVDNDGLSGIEVKLSYHFRDKRSSIAAASYDPDNCEQPNSELAFAKPAGRMPPSYPERCMYNASKTEEVLVTYDVLPSGATDNIRVSNSTHECLNSAAVASVAKWKYQCSTDGKLDLQTIITFQLEGEGPTHKGVAACYIFDRSKYKAAEIISDPTLGQFCTQDPFYAAQCSWKAGKKEHVVLSFDVTADGRVHEIVVEKSTNTCFDDFAKMSLSQKQYARSNAGYENIGAVFVYEKEEIDD